VYQAGGNGTSVFVALYLGYLLVKSSQRKVDIAFVFNPRVNLRVEVGNIFNKDVLLFVRHLTGTVQPVFWRRQNNRKKLKRGHFDPLLF